MKGHKTDLTGTRFGMLTVVGKAPTQRDKKGGYIGCWYCVCDCQLKLPETEREIITLPTTRLRSGNTKSCGCFQKVCCIKQNKYEINGDVVKMYDSKDRTFLIDLDDLNKALKYCWTVNSRGYVVGATRADVGKKGLRLHRYLMNCTDANLVVDHINHNPSDNRKANLRVCTQHQNMYNQRPNTRNKTGVRGVRFCKQMNKWEVRFKHDGKERVLGYFENIADAIALRKQYEEKYYGEFCNHEQFKEKYNESNVS